MTTHETKLLNTIREDILIDYLARTEALTSQLTLDEAEDKNAMWVEEHGYDNIIRWMTNINPRQWKPVRADIEARADKELVRELEKRKEAAQEDEMEQEDWRRAVQGYEEAGTYMGRG